MDYDELIRYMALEGIISKMSDEEKRAFMQMSAQNKGTQEIMSELASQREQLSRIEKGQNWYVDFGSDVAANFLTDGLIWLGSRLLRRL